MLMTNARSKGSEIYEKLFRATTLFQLLLGLIRFMSTLRQTALACLSVQQRTQRVSVGRVET